VLVRVLGTVEIVGDDGETVVVGSPNQRLVLSVLAAHAGQVVTADRLTDAIWGDTPPPSAGTSLRTYVSRLRRTLGPTLAIAPGGYELTADTDVGRFEALVAEGVAHDGDAALGALDEALALWRGAPFGDADAEPLRLPATRLHDLSLRARERRAVVLLSMGRGGEAVDAAEQVVAHDPWREGAWVTLVEALTAEGRTADALRAARRAGQALADAGLVPGDALRRAEAAALTEAPPTPGGRPPPTPAASMVGRDDDVAAIERLLDQARLVTLVGPGGAGKTRLALEVAARCAPHHEWGARLVSLESIDDPAAVVAAVVDGLGLTMEGGRPSEVLTRAGALDLVVVLDGCEHLVDAVAGAATTLLEGGPDVTVLATSQERLAVPGEHVWPVGPLSDDEDARTLLLARARAVRPDAESADPALLARILAHTGRLPLAIEMAASQLATMTAAELAAQLEDRPASLRSARRGGPARHRSLADLVSWTADRLDPDDRALLVDLSVFAGPVEADDVIAVTGRDAGPGLRRLAARSLVVADVSGARTTFTMLGPVRAVVAAELDTSGRGAALAGRHAEHLVAVARAADAGMRTERQADAAARLDRLLPDLRAAHRWSLTHDPACAAALSGALHVWAQSQVRAEVLAWAGEVVGGRGADGTGDDLALTFASAAHGLVLTGDLEGARGLAARGVTAAGGGPASWAPREILSDVALYQGRLDDTETELTGLAVDDPHAAVIAVVGRGLARAYAGDTTGARRVRAEAEGHETRAPSDLAWLAYLDGEIAPDADPVGAQASLERAVALADSVGDRYVGGVARISLCSLQARVGDAEVSAARFVEVLDRWRRQGAAPHLLTTLRNLAVLLRRLAEPAAAAEVIGAVQDSEGTPTWGDEERRLQAVARWAEGRLGTEAFRAHVERGRVRRLDEAAQAARGPLIERRDVTT
jgi:predicted ATPase/DNA-binding SARP family transcriptional activator